MRNVPSRIVLTLLCLFSSSALFSQPTPGKFRRMERAVPGRYIVVLKSDTTGAEVGAVADALAGRFGGVPRHVYQHAIKGFSVSMPEAAAQALSRHPLVEYVEEDGELSVITTQTGVAAQYRSNGKWYISPSDVQRVLTANATVNRVVDPGPGSPNLLLFEAFDMNQCPPSYCSGAQQRLRGVLLPGRGVPVGQLPVHVPVVSVG